MATWSHVLRGQEYGRLHFSFSLFFLPSLTSRKNMNKQVLVFAWSPAGSPLGRMKPMEKAPATEKRRAKAGSRYQLFPQDFLSKLEKRPSFPSHRLPNPRYPRILGCSPHLGLLACLDILRRARFSLLLFPLLLKERTWL